MRALRRRWRMPRWRRSCSAPQQALAVVARFSRHRIADDKIVAGDLREAAEVDAVGKAVAAGGKMFVAAGRDDKSIAGRERFGHRLPQLDGNRSAFEAMAFHFHGEAVIGAARP